MGPSTMCLCRHNLVDNFALIKEYKLVDYRQLHHLAQMEQIEKGFVALSGGLVRGYAGALAGMVVRIIKPSKK